MNEESFQKMFYFVVILLSITTVLICFYGYSICKQKIVNVFGTPSPSELDFEQIFGQLTSPEDGSIFFVPSVNASSERVGETVIIISH